MCRRPMTMRIQEGIIVPAQDQQYQNFIVRYNQNLHGDFDYQSDDTFQIVNDLFGILYVPEQDVPALELTVILILLFPNVTLIWSLEH